MVDLHLLRSVVRMELEVSLVLVDSVDVDGSARDDGREEVSRGRANEERR